MGSGQSTLITAVISALVGAMGREIFAVALRPALSWLVKQCSFRGGGDPEEGLRTVRAVDELCERGVPVTEAELPRILKISKKELYCRKKAGTIRPGYRV